MEHPRLFGSGLRKRDRMLGSSQLTQMTGEIMINERELIADMKLHLNIQYPLIEECYAQGYEAFTEGLGEEDNPFEPETTEYQYWQDGWWASFYEEEPVFDLSTYLNADKVGEAEKVVADEVAAANDVEYVHKPSDFIMNVLKITGIIAASAVVGYQVLELVA